MVGSNFSEFCHLRTSTPVRRWLMWSLIPFCIVLVVCCEPQPKGKPEKHESPGIVVVSPRLGYWTAGVANVIQVTLPRVANNSHVTLRLSLQFSGLQPDSTIFLQIPAQNNLSRLCSVVIPANVRSIVCAGYIDWEYSPQLDYFTGLHSDSLYEKTARLIDHCASADSVLPLCAETEIGQIAILRCIALLAIEQQPTASSFQKLYACVKSMQNQSDRAVLASLIAACEDPNVVNELANHLCQHPHAGTYLNNIRFSSALLAVLVSSGKKTSRDVLGDAVGRILSAHPSSSFTQSYSYRFRGLMRGAVYDEFISRLKSQAARLDVKCLVAKLQSNGQPAAVSGAALRESATIVGGLSDSIVRIRRSQPGPRSALQELLWTTRQVCAHYETYLLSEAEGGYAFLGPVQRILPTLLRTDVRSAGLAKIAASCLDSRDDFATSNSYHAFIARYYPIDTTARHTLHARFSGGITDKQVDSLVAILEKKGFIGSATAAEVPAQVLEYRPLANLPTALLFVSSTCSACEVELGYLFELRKSGLTMNILVIQVGSWQQNQRERYAERPGVTVVKQVSQQFVDGLLLTSVPTTLVIRPTGRVAARFDGLPEPSHLERALRSAEQFH